MVKKNRRWGLVVLAGLSLITGIIKLIWQPEGLTWVVVFSPLWMPLLAFTVTATIIFIREARHAREQERAKRKGRIK